MKKISVMVLMGALLLMLTACGKPFTCDLCGEEKTGKQHKSETMGIEITICDDCHKELNSLFE